MNRGKTLIFLIVVLVFLIGAVLAVKLLLPEEEAAEDTSITLFSMEADSAVQLSWTYQGETVDLLKLEGTWFYVDDSSFPLDTSYIDAMLEALTQVTATRKLEDVNDYIQYGLDEPVCTVTVRTDNEMTFSMGDRSAIGDSRYLSIGDKNVYLVDAAILDCFEYGLYDVVQKETIPTMQNVTEVQINGQGTKLDILYQEKSGWTYSDNYVWFLNQNGDYTPLDTELTENLISQITNLSWGDCVEHNAQEETLADYGLTMQAQTVSVSYLDENGEEDIFGLMIGNRTGDYCYAKMADSNMVYKINGTLRDTLQYTTYHDLQPDEILLIDWATVTGMDITIGETAYEIRMMAEETADEDGNAATSMIAMLDGVQIDVTGIQNMLDSMESTGYSGGALPEGTAVIEFRFYRNTESFSEIVLQFYPYNSTDCLVILDGEARLFTARENVDTLVSYVTGILIGE